MYLSLNYKNSLRKEILNARSEIQVEDYKEATISICERIFDFLNYKLTSNHQLFVGLYFPLKGEVGVLDYFKNFSHIFNGKLKILLPIVKDEEMIFTPYKFNDNLIKNKTYGFNQPESKIEKFPEIIILPGLAFSCEGYRIGFGKGHYDKYCAKLTKLEKFFITIGVSFHHNLFISLPFDQNDHRLNYIITDKIFIRINA